MVNQSQPLKVQADKKNLRKVESTPVELAEELTGLERLRGGPMLAFGGGSAEDQARRLGDMRLQGAQRRALARQIGRTQGNLHLQRVVQRLTQDEPGESHRTIEEQETYPVASHSDTAVQRQPAAEAVSVGTSPVDTIQRDRDDRRNRATDQWAIKMALGGGAGHAGVGGAFAIGELKNRRTGVARQGSFVGGGIGVGLQTPGADPGWGSWTNFRTDAAYTFEDFNVCLARLTAAGVGIAIIGYSLAWISFPNLGANSIYVGGFNMGAFGADIGSNVGVWNVHGM